MAFDAFLKFDNFLGESVDAHHQDWIELLSFSWGTNQPTSKFGTPIASTARPTFSNIVVVKHVDSTSQALQLACLDPLKLGFKTCTLQAQTVVGETPQNIVGIRLSTVVVASLKPSGNTVDFRASSADELPLEEVTLTGMKLEFAYRRFTDPNAPTDTTWSYDFKLGRITAHSSANGAGNALLGVPNSTGV
jgi:type VI secretion system secreted protein Hcp